MGESLEYAMADMLIKGSLTSNGLPKNCVCLSTLVDAGSSSPGLTILVAFCESVPGTTLETDIDVQDDSQPSITDLKI